MISEFSPDYKTARRRFLEAARKAGGRLQSLRLDAKGPSGEDLAIDIASFGTENPDAVVLHSSGLHGVEGFAGSAIQLAALDRLAELEGDPALILVHILNPFGMSWLRRVNENNVDLNRNCVVDGCYSGAPPRYAMLDSFLNPKSPPSPDFYLAKAALLVARYGLKTLRQSVAQGQYEYPQGLFFGGRHREKGTADFEAFLRRELPATKTLIGIDVHTGLGPYGKDTLLVVPGDHERMRGWFGVAVAASEADRSGGYRVTGGIESMLADVFPGAKRYLICQEFGTFSPIKVLGALRQENRLHHFGSRAMDHPARELLLRAFCPEDEQWQRSVVDRGKTLLMRALRLLPRLTARGRRR